MQIIFEFSNFNTGLLCKIWGFYLWIQLMKKPTINNQIFISALTDIIHANLENENFSVKELALESGMSLYRLNRKLKSFNKKTGIQFIREVRLKKAMEMLRCEDITASEVAYKTGFSSPAYFNKCFHEFYGYPPGKARSDDSGMLDHEIPDKNIIADGGPVKNRLKKYIFTFAGILLSLTFAVIFVNKEIQKAESNILDKRISIAVMPFRNMTHDTTWNKWQDWIQQCLISSFSNTRELKVRQKESINTLLNIHYPVEYTQISPDIAGRISKRLEADLFIYGSIQSAGSILRLDAQLIDTETREVLKSFEITGPYKESKIFEIIDSLRLEITDFLIISKFISEKPFLQEAIPPYHISSDAVKYYLQGYKALGNADYLTARGWFKRAWESDSNFYPAALMVMFSYSSGITSGTENALEQEVLWALKLQKKSNQMPVMEQLWVNFDFAGYFERPGEKIKYLKQALEIDDQRPDVHLLIGSSYNDIYQYDKALPEFEKYLELIPKWEIPLYPDVCSNIIKAYHKTGQDKKAWRLIRKVEKNSSDDPLFYFTISDQAILSLSEGDTIKANHYIEKYISARKEAYSSEVDITNGIAEIYNAAGIQNKAEKYYRTALLMDPENTNRMKILANFLIENNRNLDEVSELMDKAMALAEHKIDFYIFLEIKGFGLYKEGNYDAALEILQRVYDEAPYKFYIMTSHLQEVKTALASQN